MYMSEPTKFERLKQALTTDGDKAIEKFLGHPIDPADSKADIDRKLDRAWDNMPWAKLKKFYEKYNIPLT